MSFLSRAIEDGKNSAHMQIAFDGWRKNILELATYKPDDATSEVGLEPFMMTLTVGALWYGLPRGVIALDIGNERKVERYNKQTMPKDIQPQTWTLRQADAYLARSAQAQHIKYQPAFPNK
jgi:hypothetical protein